jgi:polyhydroxybutyrate depolymerase
MQLRTLLIAMLALPALAILWSQTQGEDANHLPARHVRLQVDTSQGQRESIFFAPSSCDPKRPSPLVIMLHGFGGRGLTAAKETGWSEKAEKESFLVVYPEATCPDRSRPANFRKNPQAWNDGSGRFHAGERNIDDAAFIDAMIDAIDKKYAVDPDRIFITGFSNGASMAFRLGVELSHPVAAIAPVAGTCWIEKPQPPRGVSVFYITGTADTLNPLEGGYPRLAFGGKDQGERPKPAVQGFIDHWIKSLGCQEQPSIEEIAEGVRREVHSDGRDQAEVVFITVEGLGHHWPGGFPLAPNFLVGRPSNRLNATDAIWEFFQSHPASEKPRGK